MRKKLHRNQQKNKIHFKLRTSYKEFKKKKKMEEKENEKKLHYNQQKNKILNYHE